MNSTKKGKYLQIPIVSHNSEKPSFSFEEITSGKFIPTKYTFSTTNYSSEPKHKKSCTKYINNKKFKEIPIIPHDSEKPSIAIEEISFGKQNSIIQTSYTNYKCDKIDKNSKKCSKKEKSKTSVPIHESELPSICFEEAKSGKMFSNIQTSLTNYKVKEDKLKAGKKNIKKEKCKKTEIIIHDSEKPLLVFEETNAGNKYKSIQTSVTEYKEEKREKYDKKDKKSEKLRGKKSEKHDKKPEKKSEIIIHESEKPSFVFEQTNSGKLFSCVKTSETDFEKIKKLKKIYDFKEIPIVSHNSEQPSLVFEEANTGITYDFHHMI